MRYFLLLISLIVSTACSSAKESSTAEQELPVTQRVVEVTREVVVVVTATSTPIPTWTATPLPTSTPTVTPTATDLLPTDLPATDTPTPEPQIYAENNINVRGGPGTNYAVTGALTAGDAVQPIARNETGDWFQITLPGSGTGWVAGWLLIGAPSPDSVPIADNIPTPPPPPPTAPAPEVVMSDSDSFPLIDIGQEVEIQGWRFKINSIHKRKTVYFYGNPYIAFGNFLVVIIDATNLQSGTDYFARNLYVRTITFPNLDVLMSNSKADGYAQWQYDGISSVYSDVNPGVFSRMALAFDIPSDGLAVGIVFGDKQARGPFIQFDDMPVED